MNKFEQFKQWLNLINIDGIISIWSKIKIKGDVSLSNIISIGSTLDIDTGENDE